MKIACYLLISCTIYPPPPFCIASVLQGNSLNWDASADQDLCPKADNCIADFDPDAKFILYAKFYSCADHSKQSYHCSQLKPNNGKMMLPHILPDFSIQDRFPKEYLYCKFMVELLTKYASAIAIICRWTNPFGSEIGMIALQKMNARMWMFCWFICQAGCLVADSAALVYKLLATILVLIFFSGIVRAFRSRLCVNPTGVLNDGVVCFGLSFHRFESFKQSILMKRRKNVYKRLTCIHFLATMTAAIITLPCAGGHGVEVRQCRTPSGNIRFFVEHWHGPLASTLDAGTMDIRFDNLSAGTSEITTKYPEGLFNNKDIYSTSQASGWGCIGDSTPTMVGPSCHSSSCKSKFHLLFQTNILFFQ